MPATRLRLYRGPDETTAEDADEAPKTICLPASEIIPLLADAFASRRTWLADFEHDKVTISNDLYEVLLAYRFFNRPA